MKHGDINVCICTICGKGPSVDLPSDWTRVHKAKELGFDWVMVKSGEHPVYQWQCADCLNRPGPVISPPIHVRADGRATLCTHPADRVVAIYRWTEQEGWNYNEHNLIEWCRQCGAYRIVRSNTLGEWRRPGGEA